MKFGRDFLGYRQAEVDAEVARLNKVVADLEVEAANLRAKISELQDAAEADRLTIASLRRSVGQLSAEQSSTSTPLTIVIGPARNLSAVMHLIDEVEHLPALVIRFQVFRDGFYRIDGYAGDMELVMDWFRRNPEVQAARQDGDTVYVTIEGPKL